MKLLLILRRRRRRGDRRCRWDVMEAGGKYYEDMDRLVALGTGLRTWVNWVDANVDRARTRVFFQGVSPTHYK